MTPPELTHALTLAEPDVEIAAGGETGNAGNAIGSFGVPGVAAPASPGHETQENQGHLRLVRPRGRWRYSRRQVLATLAIAAVSCFCLALVTLHVLIAQNQFRLDNLQQEASAQQARYEKLRLGVAQLESPSRIVSVAEGKLGMRQPGSVDYLPAPTSAEKNSGPGTSAQGGSGAGGTSSSSPIAPSGDADWPYIKQYLSGSP